MMSSRSPALPAPLRATVLCALVLALQAGASGTVFAAAPSPLDGLRLFFTPEQRSRAWADDPRASSTPPAPESDPVVAPSTGTVGSIGAAGAHTALGRATVSGRRGVQRIEHGVPHRSVYP